MVKQVIALLVFLCLIIIAGSLGSMSHFAFGLTIRESAIIAFGALACLAALQAYLMVSRRLEIIERELNISFTSMNRMGEELAKLTAHVDAGDESVKNQMAQRASSMQTDIAAMTGIARKIAERTARLESRLNEMQSQQNSARPASRASLPHSPVSQNSAPSQMSASAQGEDNTNAPHIAQPEDLVGLLRHQANKAKEEDRHYMVELIANSLAENSFELHLQSCVTLPNRRPCNYETLVRFREADGTLVEAAECLPFAKDAGLMAELDFKVATNAFTVARRLVERKSKTPIFMNISSDLLSDGRFFSQFFSLAQTHEEIADSIVLEVQHDQLSEFAAIETESLSALKDLGYDLSLDFVLDRDIDASAMFDIGFRHLKMPIDILTTSENIAKLNIHPQDIADFARREGINLIATHVEHERQVVLALEYGVKFGQGNLFSAPKPVRIDLLKPDINSKRSLGLQGMRHSA